MAIFPQGLTNIDKRCANAGERNTLHQLKRCLSDDYMVWHDVPLGPKARQPDFVILSPRRGLLILEVKHWAWGTIDNQRITKDTVDLLLEGGISQTDHPLRQARNYAMELNNLLQADPALMQTEDPFKGKSMVPYGWGCVLSNIRQKQVASTDFEQLFPSHKTLLREDLGDEVDAYEFEKRLWGMYAGWSPQALSLPQRDRVRWHLFPEIRMQSTQIALDLQSDGKPLALPDLMQVMDLTQEQTARTLGEGHRVIHGAAGSGKTMILIFRAQQLAAAARADQPILVLCYNRALSQRIDAMLRERGVDERVVVRTFHAWCQDMVRAYQLDRPKARPSTDAYYEELASGAHFFRAMVTRAEACVRALTLCGTSPKRNISWPACSRVFSPFTPTSSVPSRHWMVSSPDTLCVGMDLPAASTRRITSSCSDLNSATVRCSARLGPKGATATGWPESAWGMDMVDAPQK